MLPVYLHGSGHTQNMMKLISKMGISPPVTRTTALLFGTLRTVSRAPSSLMATFWKRFATASRELLF